jgi:hypothetical protein
LAFDASSGDRLDARMPGGFAGFMAIRMPRGLQSRILVDRGVGSRRILVVEDHADTAHLLYELVEHLGNHARIEARARSLAAVHGRVTRHK